MPRDVINGAAFPREQVVSEVPGDTLFVPVYTDDTGQVIGIPAAGDCLFGSPTTKFALLPRADRMLDAGAVATQLEDGYFKGELTGTRHACGFGRKATFTGTQLLNTPDGVTSGGSSGYNMVRSGGVLCVGATFKVNAHITDGFVAARILKNGTAAISALSAQIVVGDVGSFLKVQGSVTRAALTAAQKFIPGDVLAADIQYVGFVGTLELVTLYAEIVTNT